jgi:heme exporter protein A
VVDALVIDNLACRRGGRLLFEAVSAQVAPGGWAVVNISDVR